ncbi:glycosyltransferase family 2 protein [Paenibacillus typhae]|uniref:Glycosyltransferase involved in cell wall bisynthesis n=1 Tax=Paenibacillus typhae TaxID=1174501 RepID=A0A1G8K6G0_9BACL|nr:glycosyltransferase [Paenibacillus typhae]SDI38983.1 Glycosyltransferase involved in cell wall bisynthesis [Paenibacillus typhae]
MKPEISIIVPIYKVEMYLRKCVDSILAQTFRDFELILVNDGSPDNCGEICEHYKELDPRVKVIHKQNGGLSDARNYGIDIAAGKYIGFVDSDDWIKPDMFEALHGLITAHNADIAVCGHVEVEDGVYVDKEFSHEVRVYNNEEAFKKLLEDTEIKNLAWDKLYKAELFAKVRYPVGRYFEDMFATYKLFMQAEKVVSLDSPKYLYLRRGDSITGKMNNRKYYDRICAWRELYEDIKHKNYPEAIEKSLARNVTEGIELCNLQMIAGENSANKEFIAELGSFFSKHLKEVLRNKSISKQMKIATLLILTSSNTYRVLYQSKLRVKGSNLT